MSPDARRKLSPAYATTGNADLLVDLSGDMLTEDYGPHVAFSHYLPMLRAISLGRPYMICAQSIGPFSLTRPLARFVLNRARAITVRDRISFDYLAEIGVRNERLQQTADLAFLLEKAPASASAERIARLGLDPGKPFVGVSVSRLVADKYDARLGQPGAFVRMMAASLAGIARREQLQLLFTPHVTGPTLPKDDRIISREVADLLPPGVEWAVIGEDLGPKEIKGMIALATMCVGTRMHANIAALSSFVPVLAIAYSHKTPGIMEACGVGDLAVDFHRLSEERLNALLDDLHDRRTAIRDVLMRSIPEQQRLAATNIDMIMELAEGHGA